MNTPRCGHNLSGALSKTVEERQAREDAEKADYAREVKVLAELTAAREKKNARQLELSNAIDGRSRQRGRSEAIRATLTQWQESHQAPETEQLRTARTVVVELEQKVEAAKRAKFSAQQQVSDRERRISQLIAKLAEVFGVTGRYVPSEERRPFQMLGADGDAYTVLEILLGDLACAEDGAEGDGGAHPGLLIFDSPRERETSPHLYDRFPTLVDEVCRKAPGLQVIITTTTPPPEPLREPPTRVLKLSRATGDLLLERRIENLLSRATSTSSDASDEEEP
jgi:hypothetical protein